MNLSVVFLRTYDQNLFLCTKIKKENIFWLIKIQIFSYNQLNLSWMIFITFFYIPSFVLILFFSIFLHVVLHATFIQIDLISYDWLGLCNISIHARNVWEITVYIDFAYFMQIAETCSIKERIVIRQNQVRSCNISYFFWIYSLEKM